MARASWLIGAHALAALALIASPSRALADGPRPAAPVAPPKPPAVNGDGGAVPRPASTGDETPEVQEQRRRAAESPKGPEIDERSILLDLPRLEAIAPSFGKYSLLNEVSLPTDAPGSVLTRYSGLEGVAVSRAYSYGRRLYNQEMSARWRQTSMTIFELEEHQRRFYEAVEDMNIGRWWERSWNLSLPPEKGGAPAMPRIEQIGHDIEVAHLGELSLSTDGRVHVGNLWFYLDDDRIYERLPARVEILALVPTARQDAQTTRATIAPPKPGRPPTNDDRIVDVRLGWAEDEIANELANIRNGASATRYRAARLGIERRIPEGNLYTGRTWNLSLRPTVTVRGSLSPEDVVSKVQLDLRFRFYEKSVPEQPWGSFTIVARCQPGHARGELSCEFELARW